MSHHRRSRRSSYPSLRYLRNRDEQPRDRRNEVETTGRDVDCEEGNRPYDPNIFLNFYGGPTTRNTTRRMREEQPTDPFGLNAASIQSIAEDVRRNLDAFGAAPSMRRNEVPPTRDYEFQNRARFNADVYRNEERRTNELVAAYTANKQQYENRLAFYNQTREEHSQRANSQMRQQFATADPRLQPRNDAPRLDPRLRPRNDTFQVGPRLRPNHDFPIAPKVATGKTVTVLQDINLTGMSASHQGPSSLPSQPFTHNPHENGSQFDGIERAARYSISGMEMSTPTMRPEALPANETVVRSTTNPCVPLGSKVSQDSPAVNEGASCSSKPHNHRKDKENMRTAAAAKRPKPSPVKQLKEKAKTNKWAAAINPATESSRDKVKKATKTESKKKEETKKKGSPKKKISIKPKSKTKQKEAIKTKTKKPMETRPLKKLKKDLPQGGEIVENFLDLSTEVNVSSPPRYGGGWGQLPSPRLPECQGDSYSTFERPSFSPLSASEGEHGGDVKVKEEHVYETSISIEEQFAQYMNKERELHEHEEEPYEEFEDSKGQIEICSTAITECAYVPPAQIKIECPDAEIEGYPRIKMEPSLEDQKADIANYIAHFYPDGDKDEEDADLSDADTVDLETQLHNLASMHGTVHIPDPPPFFKREPAF